MPTNRLAAGTADPSQPPTQRMQPRIDVVTNWFEELERLVPVP